MLRTSLYLVISIAALVVCYSSCLMNKSLVEKPNRVNVYNDMMGVVLDFHKNKHGYSYIKDPESCYTIDPVIEVKEISVYFSFWNKHLLECREKVKDDYSFLKGGIPGLLLDTTELKASINEKFKLSGVDLLGNQCVEFYESKDEKEGVLMFSPILKMNIKGYFHIALSISNLRGFIEYLYIVKEQNDGTFKVIQDIGDDWPGIGDTRELSKLKIKQ